MKKRYKILVAVCVVCTIVLGLFIPFTTAFAADLTASLDFITNIVLADRAGTPFAPGDNIAKDAELRLTYEYSIPNTATVREGDTFSLPIPDEIILTAGPSFDLVDSRHTDDVETAGVIATVTKLVNDPILSDRLIVTFTKHPEKYSDITGSFYMELAFDENEIGNHDPTIITFQVGGSTGTETVSIDFDQPPPPETSVQKSGSFNSATNEITWTVKVNEEAVEVLDGVLVDDIPVGLIFIPGSVTIGGAAADPADYTYSDPTLTYTFPTSFSDEKVVTFKTTVDESEFIFENSHGVTITENNSATLNHNGTSTVSNTASVNIPINYIEKTGTYNSARKQIDWTITINQNTVNIPDAVLTDSLAAGLTLDTSSVEIDDVPVAVPSASVTYTNPLITVNFGSIGEPHKLEFSTDVDPTVYEQNGSPSYNNTATLTGTNVPGNASDSNDGPIGVPSSVISKSGAGYNPENAEITWRITINSNKISIDNPVVTDLIPSGQEYVVGSAKISGGAPGSFSFDPTDPDASHTGTLTYTFGATITETYTIEYKATITDPNVYAANRSNVSYSNTASINGDNIPQSSHTGTQRVDSEVIDKSNEGYNYQTREIDWQIQVNQNEMDLDNVIISDTINAGQEYVDGSFNITSTSGSQTGVFSNVFPTWTYTFDGPITDEYIIKFKTRVTDVTVFNTNGTKSFSNTAEITTNLVPTGVANTDSQPVNNTVIGKSGDYTTGNTYIDWTITVNTNDIPLVNGTINDQLQEGLALDTNTVKLYHATTNASNGSLIQGAEIKPLTSSNVIYNVDTRLFEFNIPAPVIGGYILKFRTYVTDKSKSPFTNSASFNGSGEVNTGSDNPIAVAWSGSGSSGTGDIGSMDVIKVDSEDDSIRLQGAEFELEDKYGNIVQRVTSDSSGSALFGRLRFDVDYIVRETSPPTGYVRSTEEHRFQISSALDDKNISYDFVNDRIYGSIRFMKYGDHSDPLGGAIFTLYDSDNNVVTTATSGTDGVVLFNSVQYGIYTIKETTPPAGYILSSAVLTASITEYGVTETANPASISNTVITGNIEITKLDEDNVTPLMWASLSLFAPDDLTFSTPLDTQTSAADGKVRFENVPYGSYVIKETAAPTGYVVSDDTVNVTVSQQDLTVDAGTYINAKIRSTIEVLKRNTRREPLQGAIFTLYNDIGTEIGQATSGTNGIALFENVPYGNYTVKETTPPHMYLISHDIMVANILSGDMVKVISTNERSPAYPWPVESPKTGDNIELYVLIFALSFLLLVWLPIIDQIMKRAGKHSQLL